jgi:dUTP pyrophosphatase
MKEANLKIVNKSKNPLPSYAHIGDSGMDIKANIDAEIKLHPLERRLIPTGIYVDIPEGYEIQVRPRSGMALTRGLTVLNTPGTIDSGYKNEIGIILINLSSEVQTILPGEKIAQLVFMEVVKANIEEIQEINKETDRGLNGYGSTGRL